MFDVDKISISKKGNYLHDSRALCMVTHPTKSNTFDGRARGRSIHLTIDGKKSICNMLVTDLFTNHNWTGKKHCKICFK